MQILNITPTIRPSKSLTTGMFPVVSPVVTKSADVINVNISLVDYIKDGVHSITVGLGRVSNVNVQLRDPLIPLNSSIGAARSANVFNVGVTLRDTLKSISSHIGAVRSGSVHRVSVQVKNVLIAHNQLQPIGVAKSADVIGIKVTLK